MKKLFKVTVYVILSLIILLGAGGYLFIRNFDLNKYKSYASEIVEKQLGRKLAINGNASVGISLIPTIILEDVELSNASWASRPQMVKIKSLEVKFSLLPLLKKQIVIDNVALAKPEIYLEKSKDGQANWEFSASEKNAVAEKVSEQENAALTPEKQEIISKVKSESANPAAAVLAGFAAKNVSVENGLVEYADQKSGQKTSLVINSFTMAAADINSDITAAFDIALDGQQVKGKTVLGSLNILLSGTQPYPVSLDVRAYGADLNLTGTVAELAGDPRFAADINFYNPAGNFGAPETTLNGYAEGTAKKVNLDVKLLNIVNNRITGKIAADLTGKLPMISADLRSDLVNLQNFSQNSSFAFELPGLISTAEASPLVPDTVIPYGDMNKVNAKLALDIKKLVIQPGLEANNVLMSANLQNGVLNVDPLQLNFGGGDIAVNAVVNANTRTVTLKATSKDMLLQSLHKEFAVSGNGDFGVLSGGNTDIDINLSGSGSTYRELVRSLSGRAVVILNKSVIQTGNLSFLTGNFVSQLLNALPFAQKNNEKMDVKCAVVRADIGGGKAVFPKGIALDSNVMKLVSDGNINLVNDQLDFSIRPFSGKVVDTNVAQALSSFIKVRGTIEDPKIAIDDKQALKALVGVATTGPAYLGSKLVLDADSAPCYTALKGTPYQDRFPAPEGVSNATQEVYQGADQVVDDSVDALKNTAKDLKNTAKDLLNMFKNPKGK